MCFVQKKHTLSATRIIVDFRGLLVYNLGMNNTFDIELKRLREEKGISQEQLAAVCNVKQNTVSRWESGTIQPDFDMLILLADFFEVTTDELLGREP